MRDGRGPGSTQLHWIPICFALLSVSCIGLRQYRTVTSAPDGDLRNADTTCEASQPNDSEDRCALEHRTYEFNGKTHDYYFASVEFDDRGWFWDRKQMETTLRFLYERPDDQEFLIFAYAHGWQHRADACDNNTVCFQRVLERMDLALREAAVLENERLDPGEKGRAPRKIVGVYIGWRGRSGKNKPARLLSFFNRKRAANRVGIGGVTELLTRLNDYRRYKNRGRDSGKTQLMIAGHSFGGQVIYKALSHSLIERAAAMEKKTDRHGKPLDPDYGYRTAHSFGDMVILVNPAFEGASYEALQFAATNRCYAANQRPALMVVTSTADAATRKTFPIGRRLSNGLSRTRCSDQKEAVRRTVGHLPRYTTHVLRLADEPKGVEKETLESGDCGCPYLEPIDKVRERMMGRDNEFYAAKQAIQDLRAVPDETGKIYELGHEAGLSSVEDFEWSSYGETYLHEEMILERTGKYTANYPYLVVQTDETFIPSHSGVYGERFTDFLRRFYIRHLAGDQLNFPQQCFAEADDSCVESPITPCERSWMGRPDRACEPGPDGLPKSGER